MAVQNPPIALQNAGATHPASMLRIATTSDQAAPRAASSLVPRGGVHPFFGSNAMSVTQLASPGMGVTVGTGVVTVPGSESATQGAYTCLAPSSTDLVISAAHASLPRFDLIVAKVEDAQYSGAVNTWSLVVVTGTAAASPVDPTQPNNSIVLARVTVSAGATQILNASITDRRFFSSTGVTIASSTAMPSVPLTNMLVLQPDTGDLVRYTGSAWQAPYNPPWSSFTPTVYNMLATPTVISSTSVYGRYRKMGTTVQVLFCVTCNAATTAGAAVLLPYAAAQRFLVGGSMTITGSGVPSSQLTVARFASSPHLDKVYQPTPSNLFQDVSSGQVLTGALTYETT
jgi:hypothetical protein